MIVTHTNRSEFSTTFPVSEICLLEFNKVPSAYWEIRSKLYGERNGI